MSNFNDKQKEGVAIEVEAELSSRSESTDNKVFVEDRHRLKQSLRTHHIDIIAFVGVLGTGLFLTSGGALATAGPLGVFLAYLIMGIVVGFNQIAVAEVSSLMPTSAAAIRHVEQFVDEALGFAMGWVLVYQHCLPGEIAAAAVIVTYWTDLSPAIWITIFIIVMFATNAYTVRFYAETEVFFGILKLSLCFGLVILSVILTCGGGPNHKTIGFKYWRPPYGPFKEYLTTGPLGQFAAFWKVLNSAVFSYGGTQSVPNLAGEVTNPRRSVYTACRRVLIRVTVVMCLVVFCLTLIVPSDNKVIANNTGNSNSSPFVIAIKNAGIPVLPHIINAVVLTSAFSAANLGMMATSRTLFALAVKKQAPQIFLKTTKRGVPIYGVIFAATFMPLAYMSVSQTAATVFGWFQALASANLLVTWIVFSLNHIHLTRAMSVQGYSRDQLPHHNKFGVFGAWFSLIAAVILLLTSGFPNFVKGHFNFQSFFTSYFVIVLVLVLYTSWKVFKKTRYLKPEEVDLKSLFDDVRDHPEPAQEPTKGWKGLLFWK